jgi:GAF domain-containing protein
MTADSFAEVVRHLVAGGIGERPLHQVVGLTCARLLKTPDTGLLLMDAAGMPLALEASTPMMDVVEDLELALGVGPCLDAFSYRRPVAEPDIADEAPPRWLGFHAPALDAGVRGVFAFPLLVDGASIGSLNICRTEPGSLTARQHDDAVLLAALVAQIVLALYGDELDGAVELDRLIGHQAVVHQATGMLGAQLEVPMAVALAILRARAFADDRPIAHVATDVVLRRLRFEP